PSGLRLRRPVLLQRDELEVDAVVAGVVVRVGDLVEPDLLGDPAREGVAPLDLRPLAVEVRAGGALGLDGDHGTEGSGGKGPRSYRPRAQLILVRPIQIRSKRPHGTGVPTS